jgi:hypothetical protein
MLTDKGACFLNGGKTFVTGPLKALHLGVGTGFSEPLGINTGLPANGNGVEFFNCHGYRVILPGIRDVLSTQAC